MDDVTPARALHVLAVVHWIGGLGFVTLVVLPLARGRGRLELFEAVERRFAAQVRVSVPLAGASGLWMAWRLDLWHRFLDVREWWMAAMLILWVAFMFMLFVVEPLLLPWFSRLARGTPQSLVGRMSVLHQVLTTLAAATVVGAVAGAHGGLF